MTIKEVCAQYDITPDTIRYYERVGVIPAVKRTKGGIRDFSEEDIKWVKNAICMRNAGLLVEMLIEYVRLFQEGDGTFQARRDLLVEARAEIQKQLDDALLGKCECKHSRLLRRNAQVKEGTEQWLRV